MPSPLAQTVYVLVAEIPLGFVSTYGRIATAVGAKTPRQIGWILHHNQDPTHVPCHRVVFADGSLSGNYAFGGASAQRHWLESEGVHFCGDRVDLATCLWTPSPTVLLGDQQ